MRLLHLICGAALAAACSKAPSEKSQTPQAPAPTQAAAQSVSSSAFVVGIANRYDGRAHIEPVVRFDGSKWVNTWPEFDYQDVPAPPLDQIPDAWLGRPLPREWILRSRSGESVAARIVGTQRGGSCVGRIELTVDDQTMSSMEPERSYIALDKPVPLGVIREITKSEPEWPSIERLIQSAFAEHEHFAFDEDAVLRRRLSPEALINRPVTIPFVVGPGGPASILYFEATKYVANGNGGVAVTGWLRRDSNGRWTAADTKTRGLGGDGNPVPSFVPLATMNLNGREFWFIDELGYEGFSFGLMEMTPDGLKSVLEVGRGGC